MATLDLQAFLYPVEVYVYYLRNLYYTGSRVARLFFCIKIRTIAVASVTRASIAETNGALFTRLEHPDIIRRDI